MTGPVISKAKRIKYSVLSTIIGVSICCAFVTALDKKVPFHASEYLIFDGYALLCSLPGWILALPIVIWVTDIRAWRFLALLALGSSLGPGVMLAAALYPLLTSPSFAGFAPEGKNLVFLATAVSITTTSIYLLLLRRYQDRTYIR